MKGFNETWWNQVGSLVQKGSVGIKVNDDIGHYIQTYKGLRQGDSMLPLLFNIMADMLTVLIGRAKENGLVDGLVPHLVDGGGGGVTFYNTPMTLLYSWNMTTQRLEI